MGELVQVGKVLIVQSMRKDLSLEPQHTHKSWAWQCVSVMPVFVGALVGRGRTEIDCLQGLKASQCSKKQRGSASTGRVESDGGRWSTLTFVLNVQLHTHVHVT